MELVRSSLRFRSIFVNTGKKTFRLYKSSTLIFPSKSDFAKVANAKCGMWDITKLIRISEQPARADHAHEQNNPGIRMGHSPVMLSAAKHLAAQRNRPFASLRVTVEGPISASVLFFESAYTD